MPTFAGEIAITDLNIREEDGTLIPTAGGVDPFAAVDPTRDQVILGTTTLYNATIFVSIYENSRVPANPQPIIEIRRTGTGGSGTPTVDRTTNERPLYSESLLTPNGGAGNVAWSALIPADTLSPGKSYTIIAMDPEDIARASQVMVTV